MVETETDKRLATVEKKIDFILSVLEREFDEKLDEDSMSMDSILKRFKEKYKATAARTKAEMDAVSIRCMKCHDAIIESRKKAAEYLSAEGVARKYGEMDSDTQNDIMLPYNESIMPDGGEKSYSCPHCGWEVKSNHQNFTDTIHWVVSCRHFTQNKKTFELENIRFVPMVASDDRKVYTCPECKRSVQMPTGEILTSERKMSLGIDDIDLAIIPILMHPVDITRIIKNGQPSYPEDMNEKDRSVVEKCDFIARGMLEMGYPCCVDLRPKMSPGEKFADWRTRGIPWIEFGSKDLELNRVVFDAGDGHKKQFALAIGSKEEDLSNVGRMVGRIRESKLAKRIIAESKGMSMRAKVGTPEE